MTCNVTGILYAPDGTVCANQVVTFTRKGTVEAVIDGGATKAIIPKTITAMTDGNGAIDVDLFAGPYDGYTSRDNGRDGWTFLVGVPQDASALIGDIISQAADYSGITNEVTAAATAASDSADLSAAWAEGTEPGGAGTKSAKQHALDAKTYSDALGGVADLQALASDAQDAEAGAVAAQGAAETARDAAFVNADVYADIATGRAAVADGEQFQVVSGNEIIRYRRDSSTTQTEVARYPAEGYVNSVYVKGQDTNANGRYNEIFDLFDLSDLVATNLTDAATPSYTPTKTGTGLQIGLSTNARTIVFSTANKLGIRKTRVKYKGQITGGTSGQCGLSVYDGTNRTLFQFGGYNGRLTVSGTVDTGGIVSDGLGPLTATLTVEMDFIFDAVNKTASMFMSINGGAPYSYRFTGIAIGDLELHQRNISTVIHSMEIAAIGEYDGDVIDFAGAPEIAQIDRNALNGALGLLATIRRNEPSGWDYVIPNGYQFYYNAGKYFSSIDLRPPLDENDPEVMVLHVDIATGNDSSNAGSEEYPLKSLNAAAQRAGSGGKTIIKAKGGLYPYANCFRGTIGGSILQIVSWDGQPIISSMHDDTLSWALESGTTYVATLATGSGSTVFDASNPTANGDYGALVRAADLATCRATPATWFQSGTSVFINLFDGRAPDGDLRFYTKEVGGAGDLYGLRQTTDGQILYMEDVHLEGGDQPFSTRGLVGEKITTFAKRCSAKYGGGNNGTNIASDGLQVWQDCVAAWNADDGFNYKGSKFGGAGPLAIEIGCIGRWNGRDTEGTNNGSTTHGGYIVRVNGLYHDNQDRNVHDIDAAGIRSLSWNQGCESRNSQNGDANFAAGIDGGSDTTLMWLDGCKSTSGPIDIQANAGSIVYTSDFTGAGVNSINDTATIGAYTP